MSHINSDISRQFYKDGFSIYISYDVSASSGMQLRRESIILQQNGAIWSNVNIIAYLKKNKTVLWDMQMCIWVLFSIFIQVLSTAV